MGKARAASLLFDVRHRRRAATVPCTTPTPRTQCGPWGSTKNNKITTVNPCHACPCTVLDLAQRRFTLVCGPGPGAPVGVHKYGPFVPLTCAREVVAAPMARLDGAVGYKIQDDQGGIQASNKRTEDKMGPRQDPYRDGSRSPGKILGEVIWETPARPQPLRLRALTPSTTSRPRLGGTCVVTCRSL